MGKKKIALSKKPHEILLDPLLNKGTGFTHEERKELGLQGQLPYHVSSLEEQVERRYANFCLKKTPLSKYAYLTSMQDRNEILYFRFLYEYAEEVLPTVYTPTVGDASLNFSQIYNQNRGIYIPFPLQEQMEAMVANIPNEEVSTIVVTDGSRILGLGDQGAGGMTIPVGKLALYTLFGGIHPGKTLPILLDVGTDNTKLLNDPLYIGWRHNRIQGDEYYAFIDRFVQAIKKRFPNVLLQWEDFAKPHAKNILDKYRDSICSFNDDIQGTAAVTLGAILSALKVTQEPLKNQRIVILGNGSAGLGIADLIVDELMENGSSRQEALEKIYIIGRNGLIHKNFPDLDPFLMQFARPFAEVKEWADPDTGYVTMQKLTEEVHPTILIGVCTKPGAFDEKLVRAMAQNCKRPIIFPLSNPTSKSEAVPSDLFKWTDGRVIVATGSPFEPVMHNGLKHHIGQCNNVYIFPGVGLGAIAVKAKTVSNHMFSKAAEVISRYCPMANDPCASLFPPIKDLRNICREVALEVAKIAVRDGQAAEDYSAEQIQERIDAEMWFPEYPTYTRAANDLDAALSSL
ncbi:MAG: NAD-dependent malic enzyme [Chlamydiales bacterium]|nr:NAD-dependent malic enzyme [Chlamydiales bacterium]